MLSIHSFPWEVTKTVFITNLYEKQHKNIWQVLYKGIQCFPIAFATWLWIRPWYMYTKHNSHWACYTPVFGEENFGHLVIKDYFLFTYLMLPNHSTRPDITSIFIFKFMRSYKQKPPKCRSKSSWIVVIDSTRPNWLRRELSKWKIVSC